MNYKDFIQKNKPALIIVGIVLVIAIISVILYFNQSFVDEKYCDGMTIKCVRDTERGCINELQTGIDGWFNSIYYCYCNTTDKICEGDYAKVFLDSGEKVKGKTCSDEKDCVIDSARKVYTKCIAENATSNQGKCTKWDSPLEGCNYYMVNGKAKEICYVK